MRVGISVQSFYPVDDPREGARFMVMKFGQDRSKSNRGVGEQS